MAQPDRNSQRDNKGRGGEPNFNWRGVILIAIAFALIGLAVVFRGGAYANVEDVPLPRFYELLDSKQIDKASLTLVVPEGQPRKAWSASTTNSPDSRRLSSKRRSTWP